MSAGCRSIDGLGAAPPQARACSAIFLAFLRLGCTSFGGGTAGWLYRDIVLRRRWIDDAEFSPMLAVGQALPGANGIKLAVLIGQHLRGAAGAAAALFALLSGPFVIVLGDRRRLCADRRRQLSTPCSTGSPRRRSG